MEKFPLWSNHGFFTEHSPLMERLCCCAANFFTQLRGQSSSCELSFLFYPSAARVERCKCVMCQPTECCKDDVFCRPVWKLALLRKSGEWNQWGLRGRMMSQAVFIPAWCIRENHLVCQTCLLFLITIMLWNIHIIQWLLSNNMLIDTWLVISHLHSVLSPNREVCVKDKMFHWSCKQALHVPFISTQMGVQSWDYCRK